MDHEESAPVRESQSAGKRKYRTHHLEDLKTLLREAKEAEARGEESLPAAASEALERMMESIVRELEEDSRDVIVDTKKRKISDPSHFVVGEEVRFDDSEIYTIEKVHPRGLGKGGRASYTLKDIGKLNHINVVTKTETGEYVFSNEDGLFEEGANVHLNPFMPMRVYEIRRDDIAFTRNGISWTSFSKEFAEDTILAVDEKRNNNLFWKVFENATESNWKTKKEFLKERKGGYSFDKEAYVGYLKKHGLKDELISFYTHLHTGCPCCWGA